jgi:hypothetical protein
MIDQGMLTAWLAVACLAPSPHNNQPWLARATPDGMILRLDPQQLPALGPDRVQFIALGAFIENLGYAAAVDGYRLTVDEPPVVPRRTSEITVRFHGGMKPGGNAASFLAGARRRRTNRGRYLPSLPPGATEGLRAIPCEPTTSLTLIDDMAGRSVAADLAARAMLVLFSVPELRRDLAPFVFTSADEPRSTGMPIESLNPAMTASVPGRRWVLEMASADEEAEAARARFEHADTLPGWIAGGRTLQRTLVTATVLGLSHCLAAGPSEIPTLLPILRRLAGGREGRQLILGRLGLPARPDQAIASPRRAVADVLSG